MTKKNPAPNTHEDPDAIVRRVLSRYKEGAVRVGMPTLFRAVGYNWGWFSREDQRMHIQVVGRHPEADWGFWLETRGAKVFEPRNEVTRQLSSKEKADILGKLRKEHIHVEEEWTVLMIQKDWITARIEGADLKVVAYPGTPGSFERIVDLRQKFPGIYVKGNGPPVDSEGVRFDSDKVSVVLNGSRHERKHIYLPLLDFLWEGTW